MVQWADLYGMVAQLADPDLSNHYKIMLDGPNGLRKILDVLRERYAKEILGTEVQNKQERESLYLKAKALDDIEGSIQTYVSNAKLER